MLQNFGFKSIQQKEKIRLYTHQPGNPEIFDRDLMIQIVLGKDFMVLTWAMRIRNIQQALHRRQRLFGTYINKESCQTVLQGRRQSLKAQRPIQFIDDRICDKFFSLMNKEQLLNLIMNFQDISVLNARFVGWDILKIPEWKKGVVVKEVQSTLVKVNLVAGLKLYQFEQVLTKLLDIRQRGKIGENLMLQITSGQPCKRYVLIRML